MAAPGVAADNDRSYPPRCTDDRWRHDEERIAHARSVPAAGDYYVEVPQGVGDTLVADPHAAGHPTQVYGTQEWLYVCHRMAEDPGGWCRRRT